MSQKALGPTQVANICLYIVWGDLSDFFEFKMNILSVNWT